MRLSLCVLTASLLLPAVALGQVWSGTPTASRVFPNDDTLQASIVGPTSGGVVRLEAESGAVAWEGRLDATAGVAARIDGPLSGDPAGDHRLVIDVPNAPPPVPITVVPREQMSPALRP